MNINLIHKVKKQELSHILNDEFQIFEMRKRQFSLREKVVRC